MTASDPLAHRIRNARAGRISGCKPGRPVERHGASLTTVDVARALYPDLDDSPAAIGNAVSAGLDTAGKGASAGRPRGLQGPRLPEQSTTPWTGRVAVGLAGMDEPDFDDLVGRTVRVAGQTCRG